MQPDRLAFEQLPLELNFNIFSYLDVQDLATSERVNKNWSIFCKHRLVWKNLNLGNFNHVLQTVNFKEFLKIHAITSEKKLLETIQSFLKKIPVNNPHIQRLRIIYPFKNRCYMHIDYGDIVNCEEIVKKTYIFTRSLGDFQRKVRTIYLSSHDHENQEIDFDIFAPPIQNSCSILEIKHTLPIKRFLERKIEKLLLHKRHVDRMKRVAFETLIFTLFLLSYTCFFASHATHL
ncbi:MAG: F-box-like domain-containing protein [Waddliaceae bacterium]